MSSIVRLKPTNRHLLIVPHKNKEEKNTTGVLLPDDYEPTQPKYLEATVIDIAEDCHKQFKSLKYGNLANSIETMKIIVDASMVQEVKIKNSTHYMVLENYVMGVYRGTCED